MKKTLAMILALSMAMAMFTGCSGKTEISEVAKSLGLEDGILHIAVDDTYPPMEYVNEDGEQVGFDIDLAKAIGEKLGVEIKFISSAWDGIFTGLAAGMYDVIISSVSMTNGRLETMDFSKPYLANGQVIVVKPGDDSISTGDDLAGKKVGVQLGTTADDAVIKQMEAVDFEVVKYNDIIGCFNAMKINAIDCIVVDVAVAMEYVSKSPEEFEISSAQLTNEPIAVAISKGNTALKTAIDNAIDTLAADGTLSAISVEHLGVDLTKDIDTTLTE
ncbi:MAG: ABC transporter substrate-binding protein [Clostridia bacterium]